MIALNERQYRHLITALRRGHGDRIEWFDGAGRFGDGLLEGSDRGGFGISITSSADSAVESPDRCTLLLGIPKADALDQCLALATQTGVGSIRLVIAERTAWRIIQEKRARLLERWSQTIIDSAEQCGRLTVPTLSMGTLDSELKALPPDAILRVAMEPVDQFQPEGAATRGVSAERTAIAIGPEGGWSLAEQHLLASHGGESWTIPGVTLTTVAACGILSALWRWGRDSADTSAPHTRW